jgi:hypothetical protein
VHIPTIRISCSPDRTHTSISQNPPKTCVCPPQEIWRPEDFEVGKRGLKEWHHHSNKKREFLQIASDAKPWTGQQGTKLLGLPACARIRDVVDVVWAHRRSQLGVNTPPHIAKKDLWVNPTQAVQRMPMSLNVPLLCQRTLPYSYEHDMCLSGADALRLQGFPSHPSIAPSHVLNDRELRSLAGEAFFLPDLACIVASYWLNPYGPWWFSA